MDKTEIREGDEYQIIDTDGNVLWAGVADYDEHASDTCASLTLLSLLEGKKRPVMNLKRI